MQVRKLVFHPSPSDMHVYVALLRPRSKDPQSGAFRVLAHAITCLFLVHQFDWPLLRAFIEAGGMVVLVKLMQDDNLHIRGQVRHILLFCHDCFSAINFEPF